MNVLNNLECVTNRDLEAQTPPAAKSNCRCWTWLIKDPSQYPLGVNFVLGSAAVITGIFLSKPYDYIFYAAGGWLIGSQAYPFIRIRQIAPRAAIELLADKTNTLNRDAIKENEVFKKTQEDLKNTQEKFQQLIQESKKNQEKASQELDQKNSEIETLIKKLDNSSKEFLSLKDIYNRLKETTNTLTERLKALNVTNQSLKKIPIAVGKETADLDKNNLKLEQDFSEIHSENQVFDKEDDEFKTTTSQLKDQVSQIEEFSNKSKAKMIY